MNHGGATSPCDSERSTVTSVANLVTNSATVSGASGKQFAAELAKMFRDRNEGVSNTLESMEIVEMGVVVAYDKPFSAFFNFIYDILQFSSGRDKICAFFQSFAKFASAALSRPDSERHYMYRGVEDSLSDSRKIFRLFKEFREVYKVRRAVNRVVEGVSECGIMSIPAICGFLDTFGHIGSFFYFLFDNLLWAASVGLVRSKEVPKWQRGMWKGWRRNGYVITRCGGIANVKRMKNLASIWRLALAAIANALLLRKAIATCARSNSGKFQGPDDPRLFHTLELISMFANYRILRSKLGLLRLTHAELGLLAMLASACGIWSSWRKVRRKKCGTKDFETARLQRRSSRGGASRRRDTE